MVSGPNIASNVQILWDFNTEIVHTFPGVSSSRMSMSSDFLPSARLVSLLVHSDSDKPHPHLMALTALWAELVAKDVSHTAQFSGFNRSAIKCCGVTFANFHSDCYPIRIDVEDPFYSKLGGDNCQEYVRSSVVPRNGCTLGKPKKVRLKSREQCFISCEFAKFLALHNKQRKKCEVQETARSARCKKCAPPCHAPYEV